MDPGVIFAFLFFGICAAIVATGLVAMHFDHIAVFALRLVGAPVFEEARMVAALLYQHPEQWTVTSYGMEHPQVGKLHSVTHVAGLHITGPFGDWQPNFIERRIIWNAVHWHQRAHIKRLLRQSMPS
jgi:hypothetical protein